MTISSTKKCNNCSTSLVLGENWTEGKKKSYSNICNNCGNKASKKYKEENPTKRKESCRTYSSKNREKINNYNSEYKQNNKKRYAELEARRRARKKQAYFKGFEEEIKDIYNNCPKGFEVDHIYPLCHKDFCGLHVPWNLQYLKAEENRAKNNKRPEEFHNDFKH